MGKREWGNQLGERLLGAQEREQPASWAERGWRGKAGSGWGAEMGN